MRVFAFFFNESGVHMLNYSKTGRVFAGFYLQDCELFAEGMTQNLLYSRITHSNFNLLKINARYNYALIFFL